MFRPRLVTQVAVLTAGHIAGLSMLQLRSVSQRTLDSICRGCTAIANASTAVVKSHKDYWRFLSGVISKV